MKVGLYGGTFDPLHNAHLIIAQYIKEEFHLDKIIFIPCGLPPHKDVFSSKEVRLEMVQASIADNPVFELSDIEVRSSITSYSVDTIKQIKDRRRANCPTFFWIIGSDNYLQFPQWKNPEKILEMCDLIVFPRNHDDFERAPEEFKDHPAIHLINAPLIEISSTQIRALVQKERSIRYLVPAAVEAIIHSSHLYR
ncbi:MAG: nicotinate-nucleotide adenylyltransferase [bacterium]